MLLSLSRLAGVVAALGAASTLAHDFLGAESCQACHPQAFAAWQASPHARSRDSLSPQQQKDVRCVSCHSPNQAEHKQAHVTCESCHGGGQYYSTNYVMKDSELARLVGLLDPGEKSCRGCHDGSSPSLKPFDLVKKLKAIDHWTVEREARKAQKQARTMPPSTTQAAPVVGGTK